MAKKFQDVITDDSPKNVAKIEKALEKSGSTNFYEGLKAEAAKESAIDFPKLRVFLTDSYVVRYIIGVKYEIEVIELQNVRNAYRSSVLANQYDFNNLYLAIETMDGAQRHFARFPRGKKQNLDSRYEEIIKAIKERITC